MYDKISKEAMIHAIAEDTGCYEKYIKMVLDSFERNLKRELREGNRVTIRGVGSFFPVHRNGFQFQSGVANNETFIIPERTRYKFKMSKKFLEEIINGEEEPVYADEEEYYDEE